MDNITAKIIKPGDRVFWNYKSDFRTLDYSVGQYDYIYCSQGYIRNVDLQFRIQNHKRKETYNRVCVKK